MYTMNMYTNNNTQVFTCASILNDYTNLRKREYMDLWSATDLEEKLEFFFVFSVLGNNF